MPGISDIERLINYSELYGYRTPRSITSPVFILEKNSYIAYLFASKGRGEISGL